MTDDNYELERQLKRIADAFEKRNEMYEDFLVMYKQEFQERSNAVKEAVKELVEGKTVVTEDDVLPKEDLRLEGIEFKIETEKARLIKNKVGKVAWIPKKAITAMTELEGIGNITIAHWFRPKLKWEEATQ